jgi:restriction system protein
MNNEEVNIWGIHAGRLGEADNLFLKENVIGLGDPDLGDLNKLTPRREDFKKKFIQSYPNAKPGAHAIWAGQTYRFMYEMKKGDIIVYPSKMDKKVHIGYITGDYRFDKSKIFPHLRSVEWKKSELRTIFSQDALYEIGSAQSFFQVKNYADEFRKSLNDQKILQPVETENRDFERLARDEIAKLIIRKFKGHGLARLVETILKAQGYTTYLSPEGPDKGVDILASPGPLGFGIPRICVQVKSGDTPVDSQTLNQLIGSMQNVQADQGLLVSWGDFKSSVEKEKPVQFFRVRLWNQDDLIDALLSNYSKLDADFRAELPLKQIWAIADAEE